MPLLISNIKKEITADGWEECLSPLLRNVSKTAHDFQLDVIHKTKEVQTGLHNTILLLYNYPSLPLVDE